MEIGPHPVTLLDDLQRGEREAFVRFFELYRLPVYNLVLALTHAGDEVPSIVRDVFVTAYRQMLLASGPVLLAPWTYRAAVVASEDYLSDGGPALAADEILEPAAVQWEDGDLAARIAQALDGLSLRHQAALVLSDVYGLRHDDLGVVFDVPRDGVRSLLFRAREDFRQRFDEVSARHAASACRLAEQAAAASVGRSLGVDEERKLRRHAEYCAACRPVVAAWPAGLTGLALFLREAPLPAALAEAPVFATLAPMAERSRAAGAAGLVIPFDRALRRAGGALASKAAAWAIAAVCLAATAGMGVYIAQSDGDTTSGGLPLSATRQIPHGDRYGRAAGVFPPQSGQVAVARGETERWTTHPTPSLGGVTLVASAGGLELTAGSDRHAGRVSDGGGSGGTDAVLEPGGAAGGDVGSGDARNGRGSDKPTPAGNGRGEGNDKAKAGGNGNGKDKPKNGNGDGKANAGGNGKANGGGNGKANAGGNGKPADTPAATTRSNTQSPAGKPKAAQPKPTKQTRKPSKPQK